MKKLVMLLPVAHPGAQQMAAQALRLLVPLLESVEASMVEAVLVLLRSLELQVQYEGKPRSRGSPSAPTPFLTLLSSV